MTNDQTRMANGWRMPNAECRSRKGEVRLALSSFGIRHSFVILVSAFVITVLLRLLPLRLDLSALLEFPGGGPLELVAAELVSQAGGEAGGEVNLVPAGEAGEQR